MKKIYILSLILAAILLTGCSLSSNDGGERAFTFSETLWKSADNGKNWEVKNQGKGDPNTSQADVLSLAVNPYNSQNVYAGLRKGGILETVDGGETWRFINFQSEKVYGLALSPDNGGTLYASGVWKGKGKIFKTSDRGENWEELYTSPAKGPLVVSLTIDKKNPQVIFATTSENEVLKSVDEGKSWKNIFMADEPVLKMEIDSQNSNLLYGATIGGEIFRSQDGGESFEEINEKIDESLKGLGYNHFNFLLADPSVAGKVYLAGESGLAVSQNSGETWKKLVSLNDPESYPIATLAVSYKNPQKIVYGSAEATYSSLDGGENWTTSQFDNGKRVNILEFDPSGEDVLYLGFDE